MSAIIMGALGAIPSYFMLIYRAKTKLDDSLDVVAAHGLGCATGAILTDVFEQRRFRKELDEQGNEIDPRQELIDKILEYRRFKDASARLADMEATRMLMVKRGNIQREISTIGEEASEGTEIQAITLFKLMKAFEKVMKRLEERNNKPVHTVVRYNYSMEESREQMLVLAQREKVMSFEKIFEVCQERLEAIFTFLSLLELVQQKYLSIITGEGMNNFIIEFNEEREEDIEVNIN
jgi:segregation and condensation protein A